MPRTPSTSNPIWIVKIGSSLLTDRIKGLNEELIAALGAQFAQLHTAGLRLVIISSGAVAAGRLLLDERGGSLQNLQAAAAVGQLTVMSTYRNVLARHNLKVAQVLLTHYDLERRKSYLNARATMLKLLELGIVPIVNENDALMDEEVCFGNNDTLAAMTANLLNADLLVVLTDCAGLYDSDPHLNRRAKLIKTVDANDDTIDTLAGGVGALGRGGMLAKIRAARLAAHAGTSTRVAYGAEPDVLLRLHRGEDLGTVFKAQRAPVTARKRWLASQLRPRGKLYLDDGAVKAMRNRGVSLLPVGMVRCEGQFERGDPVGCYDPQNKEIARGLVNYAAGACSKLCGKPSGAIATILGYEYEPELIHRDNLALL